ncbi:MAG: GNAT family N-acetyltransferase [Candidatus Curtissbacteria bacterium]|nr:GNAT family N-acetyltransferase [Candidatus Curtissbacteria bacterium]
MKHQNTEFKKLEKSDLINLHKWLNTPHVIASYENKPSSFEEVKSKYITRITGEDPTQSFVIIYDNKPIGYIQKYLVSNDHELKNYVNGESVGVDLFIGEPSLIHKGLGSRILQAFLKKHVFDENNIESCIVDPLTTNASAIRAYEKAGFKHFKITDDQESKYLMIIFRYEVL